MMRTLIKSTVKMRARFSIIEDFRRLGLYTSGFLAFITNASIAWLVEHQTMDHKVIGSIPRSGKEILSNFSSNFLLSVEKHNQAKCFS